MNLSKKVVVALAAIIPLLSLTGCGASAQPVSSISAATPSPTWSTTEPSPEPTATETVIVKETVTASPEPTEDETDEEEPSDEVAPKPEKPENFIRLSGTIMLVNRAESRDGKKCGRILDVVVDTRDDDVRGLKFVHFHEDDGITIQPHYAQIGDRLEMKITRRNFTPELLTPGDEPFPPQDELTACDDAANPEGNSNDVLGPFYRTWGISSVPYNAETWFNL